MSKPPTDAEYAELVAGAGGRRRRTVLRTQGLTALVALVAVVAGGLVGKRSVKTMETTSRTPSSARSSRHNRLCSGRPPVACCRLAQPLMGSPVHLFTDVRYFRRIRSGSFARSGTSARGEHPTVVAGSVSKKA